MLDFYYQYRSILRQVKHFLVGVNPKHLADNGYASTRWAPYSESPVWRLPGGIDNEKCRSEVLNPIEYRQQRNEAGNQSHQEHTVHGIRNALQRYHGKSLVVMKVSLSDAYGVQYAGPRLLLTSRGLSYH